MHSEYLRWMYLENRLAAGELTIGRKKVSLGASPAELYVLSAREDHITPWRGCYKTTQLAGGPVRFVLTSSGHIAGIVNPPGPKRKHWTNDALPADPDAWYAGAAEAEGSWWGGLGALGGEPGRDEASAAPARERGASAARGRARLVRARTLILSRRTRDPQSGSRVAQHPKASASRPQISLLDIVRRPAYYRTQHSTERNHMTTYLELSKTAQEQVLATIKQGQELALAGVQLWASSVAPLVKDQPVSIPFEGPAPKEIVANSFGFAEKLLASQKAFAEKVVAASAPVFEAPKSK